MSSFLLETYVSRGPIPRIAFGGTLTRNAYGDLIAVSVTIDNALGEKFKALSKTSAAPRQSDSRQRYNVNRIYRRAWFLPARLLANTLVRGSGKTAVSGDGKVGAVRAEKVSESALITPFYYTHLAAVVAFCCCRTLDFGGFFAG
jgi:hypothetical protein